MTNRYLLFGNPNTGKTSLFNALTKSNEKTGNYGGVTTKEQSKKVIRDDRFLEFVDLPGVYSFLSDSEDESVAKEYILKNKEESVVYVCSSAEIKRNLILIEDLKKMNSRLMIIINKHNGGLDEKVVKSISGEIGVPVVQADVRKDGEKILDWIASHVATTINDNFKLDKILKLIPTSPKILKKIDKVLAHRVWGTLIFVAIFALTIYLCYGSVGKFMSDGLEYALHSIGLWGASGLSVLTKSQVLQDFWWVVLINGVGSVLVYLPQLALMLTILFLLEDMGYLPRVGNLFQKDLNIVGMNGKSIFSIIMGVGCTTSALLTTRNIGSKNKKISTVKFLPFVGCSAKLPILLFVVGAVAGESGVIYSLLIFLTVIFIGLVYAFLTKNKDEEMFSIIELPKFKVPSLVQSVKYSLLVVLDLLKKIFLTVFLSSAILWFLLSVDVNFKFFTGEKSILEVICDYLSFALYPLGLNKSSVFISLVFGLLAKENILSIIGMMGGLNILSSIEALTFVVFVMLYSPCLPALKCAKCEFGKKFAFRWFVSQTLIAYLCAFVFSTFARLWVPLGFIALIIFSFLAILIRKIFVRKPNGATLLKKTV